MPWRLAALAICAAIMAATVVRRSSAPATCSLLLEVIDQESLEALPALVQVRNARGDVVAIPELLNRGQGVETQGPIHTWSVLPRPRRVTVPAEQLTFEAVSGLETDRATIRVDLTERGAAALQIPLRRFADLRRQGWLAGNTHLHLKKLSKPQADKYLREIPLADGLEVVFLSYLERAGDDLEYTSNKYTHQQLHNLSDQHVHFGHGEEHRHNFDSHGEGYGHILLLDIPVLIRPVSIGPGITRAGPDVPPLQHGIDQARRAGGKVVWAHNLYGFEDIPNWLTGRVHANNIFDGSERGSYKDTYYRYLNVGLHVPFSTGTDWFIYDFSRAYVAADPHRPVTPTEWLERLAAGRTTITNGPLLDFGVDNAMIGDTLDLAQPRTVSVSGSAVGRVDFKRLELVENGRVVATAPSAPEQGHFVSQLQASVTVKQPTWLALRTPPPPVKDDPALQAPVETNELGGNLFAHTSPIYVNLAGRGVFDPATARGLLAEMRSDMEVILRRARFDNDAQKQSVLAVYQEAISNLDRRLATTSEPDDQPPP